MSKLAPLKPSITYKRNGRINIYKENYICETDNKTTDNVSTNPPAYDPYCLPMHTIPNIFIDVGDDFIIIIKSSNNNYDLNKIYTAVEENYQSHSKQVKGVPTELYSSNCDDINYYDPNIIINIDRDDIALFHCLIGIQRTILRRFPIEDNGIDHFDNRDKCFDEIINIINPNMQNKI